MRVKPVLSRSVRFEKERAEPLRSFVFSVCILPEVSEFFAFDDLSADCVTSRFIVVSLPLKRQYRL